MNFRLKNFKKAQQAPVTQDQAAQTPDVNAAQNVLSEAALAEIQAATAAVQAEQAEAIAQVLAESAAAKAEQITLPSEQGAPLTPEQLAWAAAYQAQQKAERIKRMQEGKARKAKERAEAEAKAKAEAEAIALANQKAKAAAEELFKQQAEAREKAKAEAEAKALESLKAKRTALEKQRDRLAAEAAVRDLESEIAMLQGKVAKAAAQAQATKEPTRTVVPPKPKLYDDNFIVALRKSQLLKAAKAPDSKSVRMYVLVDGKKVPMKDAFRAITGSTATNDELDSSVIARFFDRHGIKYVRES